MHTIESFLILSEPRTWHEVDDLLDLLTICARDETLIGRTNAQIFAIETVKAYISSCGDTIPEDGMTLTEILAMSTEQTMKSALKVYRESGGTLIEMMITGI
jgi:hypothetical protein